jgi:hypothetical protein
LLAVWRSRERKSPNSHFVSRFANPLRRLLRFEGIAV